MQAQLKAHHGLDVPVCLTDKYPNLPAFEKLAAQTRGALQYARESVDATEVPGQLKGLRTMFSCFHHFPPAQAIRILQNSVDQGAPLAVFELSNRSFAAFLQVLVGGPLSMPFLTPFFRPFSWARLFWTYIVPVIPLCALIDGVGSNLRAYSPDEMRALVEKVSGWKQFEWKTGQVKGGLPGVTVTYLIGVPRVVSDTNASASSEQKA